ncbi:hypothetical protein Y032_0220g2503 [Ancylostoma ceylanicum]|uniref:Peptidase C1A papain C-terminal domain-containing protein n=1 Tax=Ancylostoma ceylanicum TaxID=53326 RepID=A0A016SIE2_9BILA|nr:hypothetical protein Y032_0220g2503 [Ancylostoma ceylanicum]
MWILIALVVTTFAEKPITIDEFLAKPIPEYAKHLTGQALVDYVNEHQPFFKAHYTPGAEELGRSRIMDSKFLVGPNKEDLMTDVITDEKLPESYDARERWPQCKSIGTIRDQSKCGSCWAVSAAGAMSDQLCVQSNGTIKVLISDADLLACCDPCGFGCQGGFALKAYDYMKHEGVCTGGRYKQKDVCMPYPYFPCGKHKDQPYYSECPPHYFPTPKCRKKCQRKYGKSYYDDKYFAKTSYMISKDEEKIKQEIYKHGPVSASFEIYTDFLNYKEGIYVVCHYIPVHNSSHHTAGQKEGSHAIKIIGWGRANDTDYWLIANSYNTDWGENGMYISQ